MKILPSSLREKKRYIVFELFSEKEVIKPELIKGIWNSAYSLYGDVGTSKINLWLLTFDGKRGVVRCAREKTEDVRALLCAINAIGESPVGIFVLSVCGTIKGTKKFFMS